MTVVVAVDLGATSIRVCRVDLSHAPVDVEVVHRHAHQVVVGPDGSMRWDWDRIVAEVTTGLRRSFERGPVASIGIDAWGVDYGLVDREGVLLSQPHSYRSHRTDGYADLADRIGRRRLYEIAGLQLQPFNTIFQLAAHDPEELAAARHLLFLPDLLVHELTGFIGAERTIAGTSGLLDLATQTWSPELVAATGAPAGLLPDVVPAGTRAGTWEGVPVHLVGAHDTASAVVAMGSSPGPGTAFVASGTWLLVGREQEEPDLSPEAEAVNFTNELGTLGGIRLLKNVGGFWLLNECRRHWGNPTTEQLLDEAAAWREPVPTVDATAPRFFAPTDMPGELCDAAGLSAGAPRAQIARVAVESMAATTVSVLDMLGDVKEIALFGGGAGADLLIDRLAARTGVPVRVGPIEATALGNALVQGIALGVLDSLAEARACLDDPDAA
jgi:rhamnulokinase